MIPPVFEDTRLRLIGARGSHIEHQHALPLPPDWSERMIYDRVETIRQYWCCFYYSDSQGQWWQWMTIAAKDRCSCGFMPYTAPKRIYPWAL